MPELRDQRQRPDGILEYWDGNEWIPYSQLPGLKSTDVGPIVPIEYYGD